MAIYTYVKHYQHPKSMTKEALSSIKKTSLLLCEHITNYHACVE